MAYDLAIHPSTNVDIATVWDIDNTIAKRVNAQQNAAVLSPWPNLENIAAVLDAIVAAAVAMREQATAESFSDTFDDRLKSL
jgi:hypothetical protein